MRFSEEDGPLSCTGFNSLFIVTKTLLYLFSFPLSITSWGMNILVCYLLCHLHSLFICPNFFFQVSKGSLYPNIWEKGVWQGPALQTQPQVEVSQAAGACVSCPHFPIWKGHEQQSTGWFQDSVKCWLWPWFVNAEHHTTMHHTAPVEINLNCALNSAEIHPVKTGSSCELSQWSGEWGGKDWVPSEKVCCFTWKMSLIGALLC